MLKLKVHFSDIRNGVLCACECLKCFMKIDISILCVNEMCDD